MKRVPVNHYNRQLPYLTDDEGNVIPHNPRFETPSGKSMTIPGKVLPITTLIERYMTKRDVLPQYDDADDYGDDEMFDGVESMDPVERLQALSDLKASIEDARERNYQAAKRQAKPKVLSTGNSPQEGVAVQDAEILSDTGEGKA